MNRVIGILGCGWLGTPLALELLKEGYTVKGSTTSDKKLPILRKKGIHSFLVQLNENSIEGTIDQFLAELEILVINVPPSLRKNTNGNYIGKMTLLLEQIKKSSINTILFISSTSVYGNIDGEITEETKPLPVTNSGKQLVQSELLFQEDNSLNATIIRFGGLIGEDRHPVYRLSGRTLTNGEELVNLIHRKDCIQMIKTIIKNNHWNTIFNGVYPYYPTKKEYYTAEAKKRGITPPTYTSSLNKITKKKVFFKNFYVKMYELSTSISS